MAVLVAVVDAGGYAQAAAKLHKSQSAITYGVQKLEALLGVKALGVGARRTPRAGVLYRRARRYWKKPVRSKPRPEISPRAGNQLRLAVEIIFPTWLLLQCFARFGEEQPQTRIELYEACSAAPKEALLKRTVDLAICSRIPQGFAEIR
jgi:DNA-binding transcriptional LysR family regulator